MTKILTTQNAQITTAAVEVKTLTISGKQVTQSVFKQLEDAPLFHTDGHMLGEPWGRVNYCPSSKCQRTDRELETEGPLPWHLHIVWQEGDSLRRCIVWAREPHRGWGGRHIPGRAVPNRAAWEQLSALPHLFIAV